MTPVGTLRELWHRRSLVAVGIAIALAGGLAMSYRVSLDFPPKLTSRQYDTGLAAVEVLVDSPQSQAVDLGDGDPEDDGATIDIAALNTRARLLANLTATRPLSDRIASTAGVRPDTLIVIPPPSDELGPRVKPATGTTVELGDRDANVLNLYVDETLPIITIRVQARDAVSAGSLASASVSELAGYLRSAVSAGSVPDARQIEASALGPARSATVVRGPRRLFAVLVCLLILGSWCVGMIMFPRLVRTWGHAARLEAAQELAEADADAGASDRSRLGAVA